MTSLMQYKYLRAQYKNISCTDNRSNVYKVYDQETWGWCIRYKEKIIFYNYVAWASNTV